MSDIGTKVEIVGVREKEVGETRAEELAQYYGRRGVIAKWIMGDCVKGNGISVEVPIIILDDGQVLYGSEVWWQRL